jgi:serine/threonine protein kinase/WD40 repeat protein
MADDDRKTEMVLELAEEFLDRYRKGERPPLREYTERHPDLASEIREVFPAMAMLEKIAVADDSVAERGQAGSEGPKNLALTQLGDYRIIREIGHGGMGVVYEAEQVSLGRYVALKVLPHKALANEKTKKRFEREARAAAKLHHTNIVPVFGVGEHDGLPYYAMQFIQGLSLDLVLEELKRLKDRGGKMSQVSSLPISGPLSPGSFRRSAAAAEVAKSMLTGAFESPSGANADKSRSTSPPPDRTPPRHSAPPRDPSPPASVAASSGSDVSHNSSGSIALPGQPGAIHAPPTRRKTYWHSVAQTGVQVADALDYAHKQGIIHRDIKPSNLLLDTGGTIWVTDFGLAKADDRQDLTNAGDILGTLRYMPPEAFDGKADGRGDIYALGMTLYELLAFRPAFDEKDRNRLIKQVTTSEPARLDRLNREVPRDLVTIVHKAIAREPAHRYQTPGEMAEDLKRFSEDRPVRARRISEGERIWRWCRRNPLPASLIAGILLTFLAGFAGVFWQWRAAETARDHEETLHARAESRRREAETARDEASAARAAAEAETYSARLNEVRALRAGRAPGWRDKALSEITRLAAMPTSRRNLAELRTEAAATLGMPDICHVATIFLATNGLGSFAFSPDGRKLLTTDQKAGLEFWDVHGKRHLDSGAYLPVLGNDSCKAVYFPDGMTIAVGTRDHGVVFTDARGARTTREPIIQGTSQPIKLALDARGERLAIAWNGGAGTTIYDAASGVIIDRFKDSTPVFALSPDGNWLARAEKSEIVLLAIGSTEPRIALGRHGGARALAFSPDGKLLAVANLDHTISLWDLPRREQFSALRGHREMVYDVAFSPDGEWIATGSLDYTVRIWETRTGQNIATLSGNGPGVRVEWSPTGEFLASTTNNHQEVFLYKVTGRNGVQTWLTGHRRELASAAAHPRLERIATSGYDELFSWDLTTARPSPVDLGRNPGAVTSLTYNSDGSLLAIGSWPQNANSRHMDIRDAASGELRRRLALPQIVYSVAFDPKESRLATGDVTGAIDIWDLATGTSLRTFSAGPEPRAIAYLEHPRRLVSNNVEAVMLFDPDAGRLESKAEFPGNVIRSLAVTPAGDRVLVGLRSGELASLALPDLTPGVRIKNAHARSVECLAFSPDGCLLATAGADHRVIVRDAVTLDPLFSLPVWIGSLRGLTFDCRSRRLAVVGTNSEIDLWNLHALRDGLSDLGLAWEQRTPDPPRPVDATSPSIPIIRARPDVPTPP